MIANQTVVHRPAYPTFRPCAQPLARQRKVGVKDYGLLGGWLDSENILPNFPRHPERLPRDVERIATRILGLGQVACLRAFGDFGIMSRNYNCNVRPQFEAAGFQCHPQKSHRGKNSADMAMATDILDTLYRQPAISTIVLATGDSDFRPVVEWAHRNDKEVVLLAHESCLSRCLRNMVDEVILLSRLPRRDKYV